MNKTIIYLTNESEIMVDTFVKVKNIVLAYTDSERINIPVNNIKLIKKVI